MQMALDGELNECYAQVSWVAAMSMNDNYLLIRNLLCCFWLNIQDNKDGASEAKVSPMDTVYHEVETELTLINNYSTALAKLDDRI